MLTIGQILGVSLGTGKHAQAIPQANVIPAGICRFATHIIYWLTSACIKLSASTIPAHLHIFGQPHSHPHGSGSSIHSGGGGCHRLPMCAGAGHLDCGDAIDCTVYLTTSPCRTQALSLLRSRIFGRGGCLYQSRGVSPHSSPACGNSALADI